jgi:hypothetical protein
MAVTSMQVRSEVLSKKHEETLSSMGMVSIIYLINGKQKKAEELFMQVMETRKRVLGAGHPDTLTSMANLAHTWKAQSRRGVYFTPQRRFLGKTPPKMDVYGAVL